MARRVRALVLVAVALLVTSCDQQRTTAATASRVLQPLPSRAEPARPLLTVDHWRALYDEAAASLDRDSEQLSRSADSFDFYELSYALDAAGSMFEATGDPGYARTGLHFAENMIASARPSSTLPGSSFHDSYHGWVSAENGGDETPLYESYAWRYVTRLLRLVQPGLSGMPGDVQGQYARVLQFTERDILDKWEARGAEDNIYRSRTHMAAHWAMIALDLSRLTGDAGRRTRCAQIVSNIDDHLPNYSSSLHRQMLPNPRQPAAYWWSDVWGDTAPPGQDVSHGSGVIAYVVESRDVGGSWTADDVARLGHTLTDVVIADPDKHPEFVDGSGRDNGWIADGWVKLGRYDAAVQAQLETYPVQNAQYFAAMADNARLLGAVTG